MAVTRIHYDRADAPSRALAAADPELGRIIDEVGCVDLEGHDTPFESLARSIVGQQLSGTVATRIWERLGAAVGTSPARIAAADQDALLAVGLSHRKAEYLQGLAAAVVSGDLDLDALEELPDDEVRERLTALRGLGPWTAHMYLMFQLARPDVLAVGDAGVRSSVGKLRRLGRPATEDELRDVGESWRPYRSVALFYLWAAGDSGAFLRCGFEEE